MWNLPEPGIEPVSPAIAGRFLTTGLPGKPNCHGPALVDPGTSKCGWSQRGKLILFINIEYKIRLGRHSVVGKLSGGRGLNNLDYMEDQ